MLKTNSHIYEYYGAAQALIWGPTETTLLRWARRFLVLLLFALATGLGCVAYLSRNGSFQQSLWIELAGGVFMFAGTAVALWNRRVLWFGIALTIAALAAMLEGVAQALLIEVSAGLILLLGFEIRLQYVLAALEKRIAAAQDRQEEAEGILNTPHHQR